MKPQIEEIKENQPRKGESTRLGERSAPNGNGNFQFVSADFRLFGKKGEKDGKNAEENRGCAFKTQE